jgi:hypothetical protein
MSERMTSEADEIAKNIIHNGGIPKDYAKHALDIINPQLVTLAKAHLRSQTPPLTDEEIATFQNECAGSNSEWGDWPNIDMQRALATITSLQSDLLIAQGAVDIQSGELNRAIEEYAKMQARAEAAEADLQRTREALSDIANTYDISWREGSQERMIGDKARAALTPPTGT